MASNGAETSVEALLRHGADVSLRNVRPLLLLLSSCFLRLLIL